MSRFIKFIIDNLECIIKNPLVLFSTLFIINFSLVISSVHAIYDPLSVPNNKVGIHIISPVDEEASPAAQLANSSGGDWGYVTVLIESKDRDQSKWQQFFDTLRRRHLIPLVRIATEPEGNFWKRPVEGEETAWANFLDSLVWPIKNRYVIVYNEPNQGQEWGGAVDPISYAQSLDKTITSLKTKNADFFVLNAGLDASAPQKVPSYADESSFLAQMNAAIPGIFNKLDGWVSHSYPNPNFSGSVDDVGRGTIRTWVWEMQLLQSLGLTKQLPVFITETGWKHAEGLNYDRSLPTSDQVAEYLKEAFQSAWTSNRLVAVTPFLLTYQDAPFDHFSFKKLTGQPQNPKVLGASYPEYYSPYQTLADLPKTSGAPIQENKAEITKGSVYPSLVGGESYQIPLTFKNTGQSIWGEGEPVELRVSVNSSEFQITPSKLNQKIEPGKDATFILSTKAPLSGKFNISLQLFKGDKPFDSSAWNFAVEVKSPVILSITGALAWKSDFSGKYLLTAASDIGKTMVSVILNSSGQSEPLEARYLLPDHEFDFTLQRQYYKPEIVHAKLRSGVNNLDFPPLQPDIISAILNPQELLKLLPFSN